MLLNSSTSASWASIVANKIHSHATHTTSAAKAPAKAPAKMPAQRARLARDRSASALETAAGPETADEPWRGAGSPDGAGGMQPSVSWAGLQTPGFDLPSQLDVY